MQRPATALATAVNGRFASWRFLDRQCFLLALLLRSSPPARGLPVCNKCPDWPCSIVFNQRASNIERQSMGTSCGERKS
ncbi:hypothetical protein B0H66DRAFT_539437 [Apodospora peruviana]|uniref:Secreted protein n=1 Tax=Apodospora peruviana TaxID=516989 RepID=A0AAE0IQU1_9PEZI|nr:hypothetical protein B0H66DRAFT_539437 [Apodospora peruviana]